MKTEFNFAQSAPSELGFVMPGEWAAHRACWMAWPSHHVQWENLPEVAQSCASLATLLRKQVRAEFFTVARVQARLPSRIPTTNAPLIMASSAVSSSQLGKLIDDS